MLDLNDLLCFAEVVDRRGFAAAARGLGVPKSTVSRRIAALEARLGVRLLQRTTRSVSPTEAGEALHTHAVALREQAEAAEDAVARVLREPRGTVRVTCPVTLAQTTLASALPVFLAAHPQVRIELQATNRVVDLVQDGVDVALRVRPELDEGSGSLVARNLGATRGQLVAAPALLARVGPVRTPADLARVPSVAMSAAGGVATWPLVGPAGEALEHVHRPVLVADDLQVLLRVALGGAGMALLPESLCGDALRDGSLAEVLPGWVPRSARVLAVFPSRRGMVPAVRRFVDFLAEHVSGDRLAAASGSAGVAPAVALA
jgi:DNA-binding transcriptional LysR family regulator